MTPPGPVTTLRTPSGSPASAASSARRRALSGDWLAGLSTTELPVGERRAELPGRDDQRVVPGHDRGDHADRLAGDERQRIGPGRPDLAVDLVDRLGVPLERRRGARDVDPERVADRLADVERFEQGELLEVLADELRQAEQDPLAGGRRLVRPATIVERAPGCRHRPVDILDAALGDGRDPRSVAAGDVVERPARGRRHEPAVDEQLGPRRDRGGPGEPVGGGGGRGASVVMPRTAAWPPRRGRCPRPGADGTCRIAVGTRPDRLGEHEVAALGAPAGRVVRELEERPATDAGRDVQVGQQPDPVRPGVRREPAVARERELGERARRGTSRRPGRRRADRRRTRRPRSRRAARRTSGSSRRRRCGSPAPSHAARPVPRRSVPASGSSSHRTS